MYEQAITPTTATTGFIRITVWKVRLLISYCCTKTNLNWSTTATHGWILTYKPAWHGLSPGQEAPTDFPWTYVHTHHLASKKRGSQASGNPLWIRLECQKSMVKLIGSSSDPTSNCRSDEEGLMHGVLLSAYDIRWKKKCVYHLLIIRIRDLLTWKETNTTLSLLLV